jgi:aspartyl protease family protein
MIKTIITAALLLGSTMVANADENFICGTPVVTTGAGDDPNPVVAVEVNHSAGSWQVIHRRANGEIINRANQYSIRDTTNASSTGWTGSLNRNPNVMMIGKIILYNGIHYVETIHDMSMRGVVTMAMVTECQRLNPLPKPVVASVASTSVPIYSANGSVKLDVLVGGLPIRMLLDTGANLMSVTFAVAERLVNDSQGYWKGSRMIRLADGRIVSSPILVVNAVRVGGHVIRDVESAVTDGEVMLLPFPVLDSIGKFTIDTRNQQLVFN